MSFSIACWLEGQTCSHSDSLWLCCLFILSDSGALADLEAVYLFYNLYQFVILRHRYFTEFHPAINWLIKSEAYSTDKMLVLKLIICKRLPKETCANSHNRCIRSRSILETGPATLIMINWLHNFSVCKDQACLSLSTAILSMPGWTFASEARCHSHCLAPGPEKKIGCRMTFPSQFQSLTVHCTRCLDKSHSKWHPPHTMACTPALHSHDLSCVNCLRAIDASCSSAAALLFHVFFCLMPWHFLRWHAGMLCQVSKRENPYPMCLPGDSTVKKCSSLMALSIQTDAHWCQWIISCPGCWRSIPSSSCFSLAVTLPPCHQQ